MATTEDILKEIVSSAILLQIGQRTVMVIKQRTSKGEFLPGSSSDAKDYSTKPFSMPIGAVQRKSVLNNMLKGKYEDDTQLFTSRSGRLWVAIKKGYKWMREQSNKQSENVDLRWSGRLMRSLKVIKVDTTKGEIEIDHSDSRNQKLAEYFNISGTGKSKKLRKYLGVTDEELLKAAEGLFN